jgi:hypothetical protein
MVIYFFIPGNLLIYYLMKQQQNPSRIVKFSETDKMKELSGLKITIPVYGNDVTKDKPNDKNEIYRSGPFNKRGGMKIFITIAFFFSLLKFI